MNAGQGRRAEQHRDADGADDRAGADREVFGRTDRQVGARKLLREVRTPVSSRDDAVDAGRGARPEDAHPQPAPVGVRSFGATVPGLHRRTRDLLDALGRGDPSAAEQSEEEQDDRDSRDDGDEDRLLPSQT